MTSPANTLKQRITKFWAWYSDRSQHFFDTIEAGNCPSLQPEVSQKVSELLPGFAWVFGPGENGGHSFTLSGEGDLNKQFLTSYWLSRAPQLEGWTFYSTRQPSEIHDEMAIEINGTRFEAGKLQIDTEVDFDQEKINLAAWDPAFEQTDDENLRYHVVFIWLDEVLGETGTQTRIGTIDLQPNLSDKSIPVTKLRGYVDYVSGENGWQQHSPDQMYTTYELPEPSEDYPRADTIAGTTCNMNLIGSFLESGGNMEDMLAETGAEFWYLDIDPSIFPEGKQVDFRGQIEDAVDDALQADGSGRVFGGALGFKGAYVDLVIFDGNESLRLIEKVMTDRELDGKYKLHPFATA